jgi:hypothetical protein
VLHPGDYVACCDEKPSIMSPGRKHTTLPAVGAVKRGEHVEHPYNRRAAPAIRGVGGRPREAV